jgi:RNase P subunit RPR2
MIVCDKCKKEIVPRTDAIQLEENDKVYDMCKECVAKIKAFLLSE